MTNRILVIDSKVKVAIRELMERARCNPVPLEIVEKGFPAHEAPRRENISLKDRKPGYERPKADHILIPQGFRAAYSVEEQPIGLCGHLSISVETPGSLPHPYAIHMIAVEFCIDEILHMWTEEFDPGHHAVNILATLKTN